MLEGAGDLFMWFEAPVWSITSFLPQTAHDMLNIPAMLVLADLHRALVLKEMCFECLFVRGAPMLADPAFDTMAPPLLLELFRDFATRRLVRTQFAVPPADVPEEEEEEYVESVVQDKKRRRAAPRG